jgi:hypothetical protein
VRQVRRGLGGCFLGRKWLSVKLGEMRGREGLLRGSGE